MSFDEIRLRMPRVRPFHSVAHLVLGGLAVRHDLTYENLEDLQLALEGLLEQEENDDEVTVSFRVRETVVETRVGPFDGPRLRAELDRDGGEFGLRRVLDTVCDRVEVGERDGGHWVELTKTVQPAPAERQ